MTERTPAEGPEARPAPADPWEAAERAHMALGPSTARAMDKPWVDAETGEPRVTPRPPPHKRPPPTAEEAARARDKKAMAEASMASLRPGVEPVAWMDDFGNAFPLSANKGAGSWLDEHKRNWKPLYAHPAPAEPPMDEGEWLKAHEALLDSLVWAASLMGKFGGGEDKTKQAREAVRLHLSRRVAVDRDAAPAARPLSEYHEDHGPVLWWTFPINEPPYSGTPTDDDWPGCHTHWTPIVVPKDPTS